MRFPFGDEADDGGRAVRNDEGDRAVLRAAVTGDVAVHMLHDHWRLLLEEDTRDCDHKQLA